MVINLVVTLSLALGAAPGVCIYLSGPVEPGLQLFGGYFGPN